jgi:hypothetical protein
VNEYLIEAIPNDQRGLSGDQLDDLRWREAFLVRTTLPAFLQNEVHDVVQHQVPATAPDVTEIEVDGKWDGLVRFAAVEEPACENFASRRFAQSGFPEQDGVRRPVFVFHPFHEERNGVFA